MSRLVVVSNRVAVPGENRAGGLAVGLLAALKERGGLWFGWSGKTVKEGSGTLHRQKDGDIDYVTMDLSKREVDGYYNGFANRTLWPLLHFRLDLVDYDRGTRETYHKVNALFADKLAPLLREDDIVWIHDYHLIPLGALLRERGIGCRIGFFLHIPMPSADLLQAMPDHLRLFSALYAYDLVGFQTQRDADRFQTYLRLFGGGRVLDNGELEAPGGRRFRAAAFPIGIDTELIARQAGTAATKAAVKNLRNSLRDRQLAIGVDRLDYSKGLPERFLGFERYLERHPDQRGSLTYLQIAPVSRGDVTEYRQLRSQLEQIAGHINGGHAEPDWTPLRYVNQNFTHATLTGFYRAAAVGLVTPLRDGMNLVAKEYVASQDPEDPGVLVLSLLAGAADELKQALLVNPHDLDGVADAIATAATMSLSRRKERWHAMMEHLRTYDINHWRRSYLDSTEDRRSIQEPRGLLRCGQVTGVMPPEPAVTVACQRAIRGITPAARHCPQHAAQTPGAAQPRQHAQDRIGIGPGALRVQQQERHRVLRVQPVRAQHRAALCALHRRKAIAPPAVEAQQEAHPAVAQRAYAIEYDHRAASLGGGLTAVRASLHSGSELPPRAASHRPGKCNAHPARLRGNARHQTSASAAGAARRPRPAAQTSRCHLRGPADQIRSAPRPTARAGIPHAPTAATPSASAQNAAPTARPARVP